MKKFIFCPGSAELECYCMSYNKCMISPNCSKCFPNHPACNLYLQRDVMECLSKKLIFKAAQNKNEFIMTKKYDDGDDAEEFANERKKR